MKFPTTNLLTSYASALAYRSGVALALSIALVFNTLFTTALANTHLNPFVAEYTAENDYVIGGKATLSLKKNDKESFDFVLQSKPTGIFKWTGKGNIREHAVLPSLNAPFESSSYSYSDKGNSNRDYHIDFDRANNKFQFTKQGQTQTYPLSAGALDRLSVTLVILNQLQKGSDFSNLNVDILNGTDPQKIVFTNHGTEPVNTEIGQIDALRVRKEHASSDRETIIWLAQMDNTDIVIPIKIEQLKRGKLTMRLVLTDFSMVE